MAAESATGGLRGERKSLAGKYTNFVHNCTVPVFVYVARISSSDSIPAPVTKNLPTNDMMLQRRPVKNHYVT
jgi:hypothetical protein